MATLNAVELKAFVPARDFRLSLQFYRDLGFEVPWETEELASLRMDRVSFLLQNFYVKELAENLMLHLLVDDVDGWWKSVSTKRIAERYSVRCQPPQLRPWGMRDFTVLDPSGVLWRIGQTASDE